MKRLLPPGLLGLNLAATVAACMSSLDSVFTAAASLFCLDLYHGYSDHVEATQTLDSPLAHACRKPVCSTPVRAQSGRTRASASW